MESTTSSLRNRIGLPTNDQQVFQVFENTKHFKFWHTWQFLYFNYLDIIYIYRCIFQLLQAPERQIDEAFKPHVTSPIQQVWQSWWEIKGFTIPSPETSLVCVYLLPWLWWKTCRNSNFKTGQLRSHTELGLLVIEMEEEQTVSEKRDGMEREEKRGRRKEGGVTGWYVKQIKNMLFKLLKIYLKISSMTSSSSSDWDYP